MNIKPFIYIALSLSVVSFGQERQKDTIDNQVVNVVKPYTPTISDAFKIKGTPKLNASTTIDKKPVKYTIFSIPVASTFTPAKAKAARVDKAKAVKLFNNYASLGLGNYTTAIGEVYLNHELSSTETVGGYLSHHNTQGGIDELVLDNNFSKTKFNANYKQQLRELSWRLNAGFDLQSNNWYGLPSGVYTTSETQNIDPKQTYTAFYVDGKLDFKDAIIDGGDVLFRRFGDDKDSGENRFVLNTDFNVAIRETNLKTSVFIDYLSGEFDTDYQGANAVNYGNITFGITPMYQLKGDDFTVDAGVSLVYLNAIESNENKFYVYPNILASYNLVDVVLITYGGVKGELLQNSYYDFVNVNPFVSPTLSIAPTDMQYKGFLGFKGKLSNTLSYDVNASYSSENNKALFKSNMALQGTTNNKNYQYGNSFGLMYDDVSTLSIAGAISFDVNQNFNLSIKGEYFNYTTSQETQAWNLPDITGSINLDYQISEKWFTGGSLFYVGERKEELTTLSLLTSTASVVTLESYLDANLHLGYKINDRFSVFAKANNMAGKNYERWVNYPVQGIQFIGGGIYQFDF